MDISTTIVDNDVQWVESDPQHVQDTINAAPGWYKENPADGVDVRAYLSSDGQEQVLARKIAVELRSDLYVVQNPIVRFDTSGHLFIQPNATLS